jgi:hypothetical protein
MDRLHNAKKKVCYEDRRELLYLHLQMIGRHNGHNKNFEIASEFLCNDKNRKARADADIGSTG